MTSLFVSLFCLSATIVCATQQRGRLKPPVPGGDYIVLFERTNYRGNPTNHYTSVPRLNRRAQSVTIGRGVWELCEGRNFTGRCVTLDTSTPDLGRYGMRNRVASARPVGSSPPPAANDWYVVLFDQPNFHGNPTNFNRQQSNLSSNVRSVTIGKGVWELCDGRFFTGRCVTLNTSVPDLSGLNIGRASVRCGRWLDSCVEVHRFKCRETRGGDFQASSRLAKAKRIM